jgi:hypothetical protein
MTTTNVKDLLLVLDSTRQHFETLFKILQSTEGKDRHEIANQILIIDLKVNEIQKRLDELRRNFR